MKSTMCFFVRDLTTRRIVHHEIEEIDSRDMPADQRAAHDTQRIRELMKQYPSSGFEVFLQGFDSLPSLLSAWPELAPEGGPT